MNLRGSPSLNDTLPFSVCRSGREGGKEGGRENGELKERDEGEGEGERKRKIEA
jgi:hypothetical protein